MGAGRLGWNESYLVHAFLAFNDAFAVRLSIPLLVQRQLEALLTAFPGFAAHLPRAGSSLWIQRV